jgi:quercetin dioxygenase-like cupin family protein
MSSIDRPLSGGPLRFTLSEERAHAVDSDLLGQHRRNARTLVKEDGLRVTLVAVAPGGEIPSHQADGPISVQVLEGDIRLQALGEEHVMEAGTLLTLPTGVRHGVSSDRGGVFLLTVCRSHTAG